MYRRDVQARLRRPRAGPDRPCPGSPQRPNAGNPVARRLAAEGRVALLPALAIWKIHACNSSRTSGRSHTVRPGFTLHVLCWIAVAAFVIWLLAFLFRGGGTAIGPRRRWYHW